MTSCVVLMRSDGAYRWSWNSEMQHYSPLLWWWCCSFVVSVASWLYAFCFAVLYNPCRYCPKHNTVDNIACTFDFLFCFVLNCLRMWDTVAPKLWQVGTVVVVIFMACTLEEGRWGSIQGEKQGVTEGESTKGGNNASGNAYITPKSS